MSRRMHWSPTVYTPPQWRWWGWVRLAEFRQAFPVWCGPDHWYVARVDRLQRHVRGTMEVRMPPAVRTPYESIRRAGERLMKRRARPEKGTPKAPHADPGELIEHHPNLAEWLTDSQFEDGEPRQAGWLSITCGGGLFLGMLKDNSEGVEIRLSAPSLGLLVGLMESSLTDSKAPWRASEQRPGGKRK